MKLQTIMMPETEYQHTEKVALVCSNSGVTCACYKTLETHLPVKVLEKWTKSPAFFHGNSAAFEMEQLTMRHPQGEALYAMELALSLEKLNFTKLRELWKTANEMEDGQLTDFIGMPSSSL